MEPLKPLSWYRELSDPRKRREHGCFLVEGPRAIELIRTVAYQSIVELLCTGEAEAAIEKREHPVRLLTGKQFSGISSSRTPQGIAAIVRIPSDAGLNCLPESPGRKLIVLEGIQDPGNVGTLIRTAAALDFDGVVLSDTCADPFSPKAVQSSAGTVLSVWLRRTGNFSEILSELKNRKFLLVAADPRGEPPGPSSPTSPVAIMLGSEGNGLSKHLLDIADIRCGIPMNRHRAESLNVAVSGGILMYCFGLQIGQAGQGA